jgi:hypothetical protein
MTEGITVLTKEERKSSDTGLSRLLQSQPAVAKRKRNSEVSPLIDWGHGKMIEGVFVHPAGDSAQVLAVGCSVPWWGMVIAQLDLRIHSVLLHDLRLSPLVSACFGPSVAPSQVLSEKRRSDIKETRAALFAHKVVALEKLPHPSEPLWDMWSCPSIRLILVAHGQMSEPPAGWRLWTRSVSHCEVGGITDLAVRVGVYYRGSPGQDVGRKSEREICLRSKTKSNQPNRDLRSVLKVAVKGNACRAPLLRSGLDKNHHVVGTKVVEVRPGLIDSSGLLKVGLLAGRIRLPSVRAWFGGGVWVARPLTASKIVSAWDVPEKLGKLAGSDEGRSALMAEPFAPLKIRQAVLEEVSSVFLELTEPG